MNSLLFIFLLLDNLEMEIKIGKFGHLKNVISIILDKETDKEELYLPLSAFELLEIFLLYLKFGKFAMLDPSFVEFAKKCDKSLPCPKWI